MDGFAPASSQDLIAHPRPDTDSRFGMRMIPKLRWPSRVLCGG